MSSDGGGDTELRRRRQAKADEVSSNDNEEEKEAKAKVSPEKKTSAGSSPSWTSASSFKDFYLTRIVFLRYLAFIYSVAFLVALHQNRQLIGDRGLTPLRLHLQHLLKRLPAAPTTGWQGVWQRIEAAPTMLWMWEPWDRVDHVLDGIALTGLFLSGLILLTGAANVPALAVLWILYHSLVNVGQTWYSFGWESQLLETGFLAIFLVPLYRWSSLPSHCPAPWVGVLGYRWLMFRLMIGAGMIKVRGDKCWRELTCMDYFYETQPNPNPTAYFMHQLPSWWHRFETLGNHVVELLLPWLTFLPFRWAAMANGFGQILFQIILISTGNLSFLNWLSVAPCIWFFDDHFWQKCFSRVTRDRCREIKEEHSKSGRTNYARQAVTLGLAGLLAYLSLPIVSNLLSSNQRMNTSFEPFRLVNTYGAFGSVTKRRSEVVYEGTHAHDPSDPAAEWREYEFKCKPGRTDRRPCLISPYHYRLDWLMWFSAFQSYQQQPWMLHLAGKMLDNDLVVDSLLETNPFRGERPPTFVRARHYRYNFARWNATLDAEENGHWWRRRPMKKAEYFPAVDKRSLQAAYDQFGWEFEQGIKA